jgi:hypothetical protein
MSRRRLAAGTRGDQRQHAHQGYQNPEYDAAGQAADDARNEPLRYVGWSSA